ncbi:MarR family transcriptional regulator [Streptomyces olivaceoviridis]|uniref:MarR family winged helix-turn-helix transcriptional regulator n=1 Tax=Streptomyces olivaceoviridis TaxID=1921 RepID=UPI0016790EE6|nr:MarR family transcriptional regulator [Streptomyces olivaceoviridis]GGZ25367.1 MarR family transcriptional regulator [Streptomyces olivaceoviridis]
MHDLLINQVGRSPHSEFGLSATDFTVHAKLSRSAHECLRMMELTKGLGWEKSRVSHHLARTAKRGLVIREERADDGRGAYVIVTAVGRAAIEAAARHVEAVRRLFRDHLTPGQTALLAEIADMVIERIGTP